MRRTAGRLARTGRSGPLRLVGQNPLDEITGVGVRRKKALLHKFGSAKGVSRATVADLQTVEGVNEALAKRIYDFFQGG
jgi:excinuclease ABC subunit C